MNKQAKTMKKQAKTIDKPLNKQAPRRDDGTDDRQESRTTQWEQWVGVVERGLPHTLLLYRLDKKATNKRAPGPRPISRAEWDPILKQRLIGRRLILHTDGAKA